MFDDEKPVEFILEIPAGVSQEDIDTLLASFRENDMEVYIQKERGVAELEHFVPIIVEVVKTTAEISAGLLTTFESADKILAIVEKWREKAKSKGKDEVQIVAPKTGKKKKLKGATAKEIAHLTKE